MAKNNMTFSFQESLDELRKDLEKIGPSVEMEVNQAIKDLAYSAYASITAKAQAELHSTRQDYLKGLNFEDLGDNSYLISLDGAWAQALEGGFPGYNLNDKLLQSKKTVSMGSRAGMPWVRKNKDGEKYAYVPFEKQPFSKAPKTANMADAIKAMTAKNSQGRKQKITKIFKDATGTPMQGKVAVGKSDNPFLDNLVKYQKTYSNSDTGKQTTQSIYINYRAISENGKSWDHPGFNPGLRAFEDAEKNIVRNIDQIIKTLL